MDEEIFDDGTRRLKISVAGVDGLTGTVSAEKFLFTLYAFDTAPIVRPLFTTQLNIDQAARLSAFLNSISLVRDRAATTSGRFVEVSDSIPPGVLAAFLRHPDLATNPEVVRSMLSLNPELCRTLIETELTALDITCLAYRRTQLERMKRLLDDSDFFASQQVALGGNGRERVWQMFFEQNQWIFGYALNYLIGEGVQPDKLEQVVAGHTIASAGKRTDALLHTRGLLRSLCYVELKTHDTALVHGTEYRPDVWRPSNELVGAVAQSQKTVQLAVEHLTATLELPSSANYGGGQRFFNYAPRAIVVCGHLGEFLDANGADVAKFSSFELYRRSLHSPEIVTFDELHDRARAIVEAGLAQHQPT